MSRMLGSPARTIISRSMPDAIPPCGGAPMRSASRRKPNLRHRCSSRLIARRSKIFSWSSGLVDPERAAAELDRRSRRGRTPGESPRRGRSRAEPPVSGSGRGERVMDERPPALLLVPFEQREVGDPEEASRRRASISSSSRPRCSAERRRARAQTIAGSSAAKSTVEPGSARNASSSASDRNFAIGERTSPSSS